jgi:hypothetical protein
MEKPCQIRVLSTTRFHTAVCSIWGLGKDNEGIKIPAYLDLDSDATQKVAQEIRAIRKATHNFSAQLLAKYASGVDDANLIERLSRLRLLGMSAGTAQLGWLLNGMHSTLWHSMDEGDNPAPYLRAIRASGIMPTIAKPHTTHGCGFTSAFCYKEGEPYLPIFSGSTIPSTTLPEQQIVLRQPNPGAFVRTEKIYHSPDGHNPGLFFEPDQNGNYPPSAGILRAFLNMPFGLAERRQSLWPLLRHEVVVRRNANPTPLWHQAVAELGI